MCQFTVTGLALGFGLVESGPLVRSVSYAERADAPLFPPHMRTKNGMASKTTPTVTSAYTLAMK